MNVEKIVRSGLCSGCGLCAGILDDGKIKMEMSPDGFLRPVETADITRVEQDAIEATCPGITLAHETASDVPYNPDWGPIITSRAGFSNDPEIRRLASSGGALSGILHYLLESGSVDFVVHVGMSKSTPFRNELFESRTREEIIERAGSRYSPAAPLMKIRQALQSPGRFAVVGKPCDIAGLRNYLRQNPTLNDRIPALVSFFCAGVPSEAGTLDLLRELGVTSGDLASFKYRGDGWPGFATATSHDGTVRRMDYDTSWGTILNRHLQFRCKICPDGTGEFADIVCADGWHMDKEGNPDFSEREGRSVILTRTKNGENIVQAAMSGDYIRTEPLDLNLLPAMQPFQKRRKQLALSRLAALVVLLRPTPRFRGLRLWRAALKGGVTANLRSFLGTFVRITGIRR